MLEAVKPLVKHLHAYLFPLLQLHAYRVWDSRCSHEVLSAKFVMVNRDSHCLICSKAGRGWHICEHIRFSAEIGFAESELGCLGMLPWLPNCYTQSPFSATSICENLAWKCSATNIAFVAFSGTVSRGPLLQPESRVLILAATSPQFRIMRIWHLNPFCCPIVMGTQSSLCFQSLSLLEQETFCLLRLV